MVIVKHCIRTVTEYEIDANKQTASAEVNKSATSLWERLALSLSLSLSDVQGRRHLRSAARGLLLTPRYYLSTYGRQPFLMLVHLPGILFQNICEHLI